MFHRADILCANEDNFLLLGVLLPGHELVGYTQLLPFSFGLSQILLFRLS